MKVGLVGDGRFNFPDNVVRSVVLEADDRRALHPDAMFAKLPGELRKVVALQLAIVRSGRFQTHPHPGNAEFDELQHGVFANRIGGRENRKLPALACLLHPLQQAHGARTVKQEVLIHHKE